MLQSFKLFLRSFTREKVFSLINLSGLSLGIACSLLIYLFVQSELSHDKFHEQGDRIYRVNQTFIWGDDPEQLFSSTGPGVATALKQDIPEIEQVTRVHTPGGFLVTYKNGSEIISNQEENVFAADSNFLEIFTFPLKYGDKATALSKPNSILITEETARKYFDEEEALGKQLLLGQAGSAVAYEVTGVLEAIPNNSYIDFDILLSTNSFPIIERLNWSWYFTTFETFVLLDPLANIEAVREKVNLLPPKYADGTLQRIIGISFEDYLKSGKKWDLRIQPFTEIHLGSASIFNRLNNVGNQTIVNILSIAAIFIIVLSCINYINLKTSQITKNARATGIRKLLGSSSYNISARYFAETAFFILSSVLTGYILAYLFLPYFNLVSGKQIGAENLLNSSLIMNLLILAIIMCTLCGLYPAILLSAFSPMDVIRGKLKSGDETKWIRNGMVVFQFSISIMLIAATLLVYNQLQYSYEKDLGFAKQNLIAVERVEWLPSSKGFTEELKQISGVVNTSLSRSLPPGVFDGDQFLPEDNQNLNVPLNFTQVDHNFLPTMDIELLYGRNFVDNNELEVNKIILNETAVEILGWEINDQVLGRKILYPGKPDPFEVIGVVKDFNYWSLQASIEPLALFHVAKPFYGDEFQNLYIAVRVEGDNLRETLTAMQQLWEQADSGVSFSYSFVEESFANTFQSTERFGRTLTVFAFMAIFIAALGLLGMIIYVVEQRTKEIGIRKVLGSSNTQLISLVSKRFILLVTLALILSIPLSWYGMDIWLSEFQYRTTISPWIFVIAGSGAILIAFSIVSLQTLKTATMNPTEVLRDE